MKVSKKQFTIYMIAAFGIAWIIQIVASIFANAGNVLVFQGMIMLCMYVPFLSVLIARIPLKGMGWLPKFKGKWGWILITWFGPIVLTFLGAVLYFVIFPDRLDWSGSYMATQNGAEAIAEMQAAGLTIPLLLVISAVQCVLYLPLFNGLLALGEEVGWRGVMYPVLKEKLGRAKGMILGGILWGAWHWPVMILAGYEYGKDYLGAPFLGMALFCLFTTAGGIFLDVLYEKTECIWIPSIGHGAINGAGTLPLLLMRAEDADQMLLGPAPLGIIAMIPMIVVAAVMLIKTKK